MDAETFFLENLPTVRRIVGFLARRKQLEEVEAEDLTSQVLLKFIERDYEAIRKFERRCSFESYVMVIAERVLLDQRNHELGKWRPSVEARRMGRTAIHLEMLVHRDKHPVQEAIQTMMSSGFTETRRELEQIASRLPCRWTRPRRVPLPPMSVHATISGDTVARGAEEEERAVLAATTARVLREAFQLVPENDRAILRMRFEADMSVAEISRALKIPQKPIYRLVERHLKQFRGLLERAGVHASDVDDLVGMTSGPVDVGWAAPALSGKLPGESGQQD
jgi:RNA polymerase sigma factor (sigma-70 family)